MEGGRLLREKREGETTGSSRARGKRPPAVEINGQYLKMQINILQKTNLSAVFYRPV